MVLVVDDDEDVRDMTVAVLEDDGLVTASAPNGVAALEVIAQRQPCLVFADLTMPFMSGKEFVEQVRRRFPSVAVCIVSALVDETIRGVVQLRKPVQIPRLLEVAKRHCHCVAAPPDIDRRA
jgi:two-component system response regulator AtoC